MLLESEAKELGNSHKADNLPYTLSVAKNASGITNCETLQRAISQLDKIELLTHKTVIKAKSGGTAKIIDLILELRQNPVVISLTNCRKHRAVHVLRDEANTAVTHHKVSATSMS